MICTQCGQHLEWWPLSDRWASKLHDDGTTDVWTFICPNRPNDREPYHVNESRVY